VTVVVDFGDLGPDPYVGCASELRDGATGMDALAALDITVTEASRSPSFICRIDGYPSADQVVAIPGRPGYVEACVNTPPPQAYWTYWSAEDGGQWSYSLQGYALHAVIFGGFEGYSFAHNSTPGQSAPGVAPRMP